MKPTDGQRYCGRFAPSPTGPLHLGSLIAGLASFLDARAYRGQWRMRIEDLDPPREEPGAAEAILSTLQRHGLHWDGPVMWQSRRHADYRRALDDLASDGRLFDCDCTRPRLGRGGCCRSGCETRQGSLRQPRATRIRVPANSPIEFVDALQGNVTCDLSSEYPNFTLLRKDGLFAYQLAVVVDDAGQGIDHVVRGADLLDSTARQIFLQHCLSLPTPQYLHIPLITDAAGNKLSKQNHAQALDDTRPAANLRAALRFLHQPEPPALAARVDELIAFAVANWSRSRLPAALALPEPGTAPP